MAEPDDLISNAAFFDEASHSVRQPLLALSMSVAALQIQLADSAVAQTVTRLRHSAELLTALIEDILLVAKLRFAADTDSANPVPCQWPEVIEELASQRAAMGLSGRLLFHYEPSAEHAPSVEYALSAAPKPFFTARPQLLQLIGRAVDLLLLIHQQADAPVVAKQSGSALSLEIDPHWSDCLRVSEQQAPLFIEAAQNRSGSLSEVCAAEPELQSRLRMAQRLALTLGMTLCLQRSLEHAPSLLLCQTIA